MPSFDLDTKAGWFYPLAVVDTAGIKAVIFLTIAIQLLY